MLISPSRRPVRSPSRSNDLPGSVRALLMSVAVGDRVASDVLADAFLATVDVPAPVRDAVLGSLMTAVMARGPAADDIEALLRTALAVDGRERAEVISGSDRPVLMLAGSGKKGVRTLNVSTPAALVAAAAGARVIKVGPAATFSALGSRDLVRALGMRENRTADGVRAGLDACGFAFVAIEPEIPVLDELYGGRFHAPNPFSFGLAPLASPVRGDVTVSKSVEVAGIEPASSSASPGLLRAQPALLFSAPALTQARRRRAQPLFDVPPGPAAGPDGTSSSLMPVTGSEASPG